MKQSRFLIHNLNHSTLLVDIAPIGMGNEIFPAEGKLQVVNSLRFRSWSHAEEYLTHHGTSAEALQSLKEALKKSDVGVLTIP